MEHYTGERRRGLLVKRVETLQESAYSRRQLNEGARV
jgi:hypothetical protein